MPDVRLEAPHGVLWCDEHWKPYAAREGNGVGASVLIMFRVIHDENFAMLCGFDPSTTPPTPADGSPDRLNVEIAKIAPVCCWIDSDALEAIKIVAAEMMPKDVPPGLQGEELFALDAEAVQEWQRNHRQDLA